MQAKTKKKRMYSPEQTRERLLFAGLRLFGKYGYKGVTTRALAQGANVNQAAIPYHFGGKEGLYRAVAEMVANEMGQGQLAVIKKMPAILRKVDNDRRAVRRITRKMLQRIARRFLLKKQPDRAAFIVREYMDPGIGFEILYVTVIQHLHKALTGAVAVAKGLPDEAPEARLKAHVLIGQIMSFAIARPVLLRRMEWEEYTPERVEEIAVAISEMALNALGLQE